MVTLSMKKEELDRITELTVLLLSSNVPFKLSYGDFWLETFRGEQENENALKKFDNFEKGQIIPLSTIKENVVKPKADYSAVDAMYEPKTEDQIAKETEERNKKLKERFNNTGNVLPANGAVAAWDGTN